MYIFCSFSFYLLIFNFLAPTGELLELLCHRGLGVVGLWREKSHFCNNLDPVHWIQTKFGMDILLDPRNKPAKEFFIFLKIQDGRRRSQICDAFHFFNVFAIIWIRFIGSRQNLAWTYYLTLGTNLRKNFSFFSKSKMAAGGQKSKIGQILPHKSHFGSSFGSGSSDLDQI